MPEWEITATTVRCDTVDDEVTILVNRDATATCTGHARRGAAGKRRVPAPSCDGACALVNEIVARFRE